ARPASNLWSADDSEISLNPEYFSDDVRIAREDRAGQPELSVAHRRREESAMETTGARARSTRKARLNDTERKAKAARPAGRGRLARVVKARGGKLPAPANDTMPPDAELPEAGLPPEAELPENDLIVEEAGAKSLTGGDAAIIEAGAVDAQAQVDED